MSVILSNKVFDALVAAGVVRIEDRVTRVVIDLQLHCPPVIHVERIGDERLLDVVPALGGLQIWRNQGATARDRAEQAGVEVQPALNPITLTD